MTRVNPYNVAIKQQSLSLEVVCSRSSGHINLEMRNVEVYVRSINVRYLIIEL